MSDTTVLDRAVDTILPSRDSLAQAMSKAELEGRQLRGYYGIDPTSPHLHIGHTVAMRNLARWQQAGHKAILLIGDFTARLGDPDKISIRQPLTKEQTAANLQTYLDQAKHLLDFDGDNPVEVRYNSEWSDSMTFEEVVKLAANFTVSQMLERDMFQKRMQEQKPISLAEFFYPLMQGYDAVALKADVQFGGTDQTFNMLAGRTLNRILAEREMWVVASPLLADKDDILQIYLNEIPYGGTAYGVEAASQHFFGKSAKDLTLAEASLLAGLPQSPTRYNPLLNPDAAYARQKYVLEQMVKTGKITQAQSDEAAAVQIVFKNSADQNIKSPHFVMYVKSLLEEQYGTKLVEQGGLRVTTTLDYGKQKIAEEEVRKQIDALAKARANASNAGLIATEPKTGQILAYVGSEDYNDEEHDGNVDVIQRARQPGSAIKPITYLAAFTKGYTLGTYVGDIPTCFGGEPNYCPGNSDSKFWGPVLPREALANSRNLPAVKMTQLVTVDGLIDMAHKLGVTTMNDRKSYGLSVGLGAAEIKPYDLAQVYNTFANQGVQQDLTAILKVEDSTGKVLDQYTESKGKKIVDANYVYLLTASLSDNAVRTRLFGTGNKLEIGRPAAVKTGTTNDNKDAWTVGYTPSLSTIVWVGNFDNTAMNGIQGSTGATPIWNTFMKRSLQGTKAETFTRPDGIIDVTIDAVSGMLPGPGSKTKTELFVKGTEPTQIDTFSKVVKIDKANGLLANPASIATGNAEDRQCTQIVEAIKDWQSYTDTWMKAQGAPWGCPAETSALYHTAGDKPTVTIATPTAGQTVGSTFTAKANIASAGTIISVVFLFDNAPVKTITSIPYEYTYSLGKSTVGAHTITVKATDSNGNEGTSTVNLNITAN